MTSKLYRNKPSFPAFSTVFALEPLVLWVAIARSATNLFFYELPDNVWENTPSTVWKNLITHFSKIFKKPNYQSDSMCQLPQKSQILQRKSLKAKQFFWRQLPLKSQICEIWRQKSQSGNPGRGCVQSQIDCVLKFQVFAWKVSNDLPCCSWLVDLLTDRWRLWSVV